MSAKDVKDKNYMKINYFLEFTCSFDVNVSMDVSFTELLEEAGWCGNSAFELWG